MRVVDGTLALERSMGRLFAVVGVFDGLHRGHAYLLRALARAAAGHDARPTVITFDHHPDEILKGGAPPLLCDPAERLERLEAAGVDVVVIETFDRALRETPYDAWLGRIVDRVDLAGLLMTPESAFGYERGGTPKAVSLLGERLGFDVVVVPQFRDGSGAVVSSSAIRSAIERGDLAEAAVRLGRLYAVVGTGVRSEESMELAFQMPVALPPAGTYDVGLGAPGAWLDERGSHVATVTDDRRLLLADLREGERQRVSFVHEGASTATIRRS